MEKPGSATPATTILKPLQLPIAHEKIIFGLRSLHLVFALVTRAGRNHRISGRRPDFAALQAMNEGAWYQVYQTSIPPALVEILLRTEKLARASGAMANGFILKYSDDPRQWQVLGWMYDYPRPFCRASVQWRRDGHPRPAQGDDPDPEGAAEDPARMRALVARVAARPDLPPRS